MIKEIDDEIAWLEYMIENSDSFTELNYKVLINKRYEKIKEIRNNE